MEENQEIITKQQKNNECFSFKGERRVRFGNENTNKIL